MHNAVNGARLVELMSAGTRAIEANREVINALNVFPVPDGDTGTNMLLTMRSVLGAVRELENGHVDQIATVMAKAALLGARGNSGLILAQFFKGLETCLKKSSVFGPTEFAECLRVATEHAYSAVPDPQEGTMLTVYRESAKAAADASTFDPTDLVATWEAATTRSRDTVLATPSMLEVLKEAGVVDSGGYGFSLLLEGALRYLKGEHDEVEGYISTKDSLGVVHDGDLVDHKFLADAESISWGYCTSFAIEGIGMVVADLRRRVSEIGESVVVAGDDTLIKVHVHMEDPGSAISLGISIGTLSNISILNMDEQTSERVNGRKEIQEQKPVMVVAVVPSDRFATLFEATGLGACVTVKGGDTMNPTIADLLDAVDNASTDSVIIIPNNRNIIGTAEQVSQLTNKQVLVVRASDVPSGVAALIAFSPAASVDDNFRMMDEAMGQVQVGSVFKAVRDSSINGVSVTKGQVMGMMDGEVSVVGGDTQSVLIDLLVKANKTDSIVTLYPGIETDDQSAAACEKRVRYMLPSAEVEVVRGDQLYYYYYVAIES